MNDENFGPPDQGWYESIVASRCKLICTVFESQYRCTAFVSDCSHPSSHFISSPTISLDVKTDIAPVDVHIAINSRSLKCTKSAVV